MPIYNVFFHGSKLAVKGVVCSGERMFECSGIDANWSSSSNSIRYHYRFGKYGYRDRSAAPSGTTPPSGAGGVRHPHLLDQCGRNPRDRGVVIY
jgi:hypothetical protein